MLKKKINSILVRMTGYKLASAASILDLSQIITDPREGQYYSKGAPFIMSLPFPIGGDWLYSRYDKSSLSPYYQAAAAGLRLNVLEKKEACNAIKKVLIDYSKMVVIKHPNQLLGLDANDSTFNNACRFWDMVLPWDTPNVKKLSKMRGDNIRKENLRYGLNSDRTLTDGYDVEGKIEVEMQRIWDLLYSIKKRGFKFSPDNCVTARAYFRQNTFVWRVSGGMHRAAIASAMGYESIPVKIDQIIRREDSLHWPSVKAGHYSEKHALYLFDRIFDGNPPDVFRAWQNHVGNTYFSPTIQREKA